MQLNAERLPRVSERKQAETVETEYFNVDRQRRHYWAWNIPLLLASVTTLVVGGSALAGAYLWQSSRLSSEMLDRAAVAEEAGEYDDQVKWLTRYVRLAPNDTQALIRLGIATDNAVETYSDINSARIRLSKAIAATGDQSVFEEQRTDLRQRLIKRLLQLGGAWTIEAEQQVILLAAPAKDPQALSWLAQAIAGQRLAQMSARRSGSNFDKEKEYWKWMADQPTGLVVLEAMKHKPDDLVIATLFLNAVASTPEWFEGREQAPSKEELQEQAENLCARLAAMEESGWAQWLAYTYQQKQDPELATPLLEAALPGALARLSKNLEAPPKPDAPLADSELLLSEAKPVPVPDEGAYQPDWDWELAHTAAAQAAEASRLADALAIYDKLHALSSPAVRPYQRQATYLAAGNAYWAASQTDKAIEIWSTGREALHGSINLSVQLLNALTTLGRTEDADSALKDFEASIKDQLSQLDGIQGTRLGPFLKQRYRDLLEEAEWQADVFHGNLQMQRGYYRDASERLAKAFNSPLVIEPAKRIRCGQLLAECYGKLQVWDLAGQTLDQCVVIDPDNAALRRLAASAWRLLGAPERAVSQLDSLDDGSFTAALEIARLKATAAASQPSDQRDLQSVRDSLQVARLRWEAMPESERASQPPWSLELLEIGFAERKMADPEHVRAALEALAAKHATDPQAQVAALTNLARIGQLDAAKVALRRLQKIAEVSGSADDASNAIVAEAVLAEAADNVDEALRTLREGMVRLPKNALQLAKAGAAMALAHQQSTAAYDLLKRVPEESWDVDVFMMAGRLGIGSDSANGPTISEADLQRWEQKLRNLEGENGCNWRYLAAARLIGSAGRNLDRTDLLDKAESYYVEIDRIRPRWGMGAALGGQIAALKGDREKAITLLRRAIQDGDTQTSTVLLLVTELSALAQFDEAERELKRLANVPESVVPTSIWEVALAQRKGDLRAALDAARKSTIRNRTNANSWLVAAQTAWAVAVSKDSSGEEKTKLRAEAWDALERAASISGGKDINVWNARLRFHIAVGDKEKAKQELKGLEASPVPPSVSLLIAANGYLLLQDFETAQARAKEAIALDPKAAEPHVAMARILEQMGDRQAMLGELQAAHRLDKNNIQIREWLAIAYVLASEEIPWAEVDSLLATNAESSSAKSTMLRAALSLARGDEMRVESALATLNSIANSSQSDAITAKRVLARQYAKQFIKADPEDRASPFGRLNLEQARSLYEELMKREPPAPADGVAFALLLIEDGQLDEAKQIADKLSAAGTSSLVLQLRLKIAQLQGEDLSSVASAWLASASGFEQEQLWEVVGKAMSQLGLHDEALVWFEKAYRKDPARFASYAGGLAQAGQTEKAVELCLSLVQKDGNVAAATLLPEIILIKPADQQSEAVEQAIASAIKEHADSPQLLESVATLRLMQGRIAESVALYEQSDRLAPNRARTLNNLAIALVELPGRENAALEKITRAIQLYGKYPQFLDTLAIVQSKLGQHEKAKRALEEALAIEKDPRFQMRLAEELLALGDQGEAKKTWEQIEIERLKAMGLTSAEQRSFNKLSKELGLHE